MIVQNVVVSQEERSGLVADEWEFALIDTRLRLVRYAHLSRPSKRHKRWHIVRFWSWYGKAAPEEMKKEDVPFPQKVQDEAFAKLCSQFAIIGPDDRVCERTPPATPTS